MRNAANASPAVAAFLDLRNPQIITGTGNAGSPQNDGNADVFLAADNLHLLHAGSRYYAQKLAALLARVQVVTGIPLINPADYYDGGIDE